MDKQKVMEALKQISLDCDRVIEKGFGRDLNMLTIKKQVDDVMNFLDAEEIKQPEAGKPEQVAEPQVPDKDTKDTGEAVPEGESAEEKKTEGKPIDLAGEIGELSKEVTVKKEPAPQTEKPQEDLKPDEGPKKLDSAKQEPAQPLKHSSSIGGTSEGGGNA